MNNILNHASGLIKADVNQIHDTIEHAELGVFFYRSSIHKLGNVILALGRDQSSRFLIAISDRDSGVISEFTGEQIGDTDVFARKCPLNHQNAVVLRKYFPWTAPVSLRNRKTTIGCGDRLGRATYGQLMAIKQYQAAPVLAQQSMRELKLTGRTFEGVVDDASFQVFQAGYKDGFGADGDHLKTMTDIDYALAAGMTMITLDLSEVMNAAAGSWDAGTVEIAFDALPEAVRAYTMTTYAGPEFLIGGHSLRFTPLEAKRCAVMYNKALDFAAEVHRHLSDARGKEFDLEVSIDETSTPTLPNHHLYIARELLQRKVEFTSLAPRFVGEFQKAVDYIGDLGEFERQFAVHAAIASEYRYKISVHSGSDKFAVYPTIGKYTGERLHLKTAGTSWLEAVKVIAQKDPALYRVMHQCALDNFDAMLKLYHITADINKIPNVDKIYNDQLAKLMDMPEARQLLHITYGAILTDKTIGPLFFAAIHKYMNDYVLALKKHFEKHLSLLGVPLR